jgi:hypothetical protein
MAERVITIGSLAAYVVLLSLVSAYMIAGGR